MASQAEPTYLDTLEPATIRSLIARCDDGIVLLDQDQRITWANDSSIRLFQYDRPALIGRPFRELFADRQQDLAHEAVTNFERGAATALTLGGTDSELRGQRADGTELVTELSMVRADDQETPLIMVFVRDRTAWHTREQELDTLARTDALTGALNRRAFVDRANAALNAGVGDHSSALLLVDIDAFKAINDTYGHPAGDAVIIAVVERLGERCRTHDLIGRWGGEEFIVLMQGAAEEAARDMSERIRHGISATPIDTDAGGTHVKLTASIGIATTRADEHTLDELIAGADRALYHAKAAGGDCVRVHDFTLDTGDDDGTAGPTPAATTGHQHPAGELNDAVAEALVGPMRTYLAVFGENFRTLADLQATATRHYASMALTPAGSTDRYGRAPRL